MWLIKGPYKLTLTAEKEARLESGVMVTKNIKSKKPGSKFKFNNLEYTLLKPRFVDIFMNIRRGPQIITLKDAALICSLTGLSSGDKIVEAGTGSGALTIFLANHVQPKGKIFAYEVREDFLKLSQDNVEFAGLSKYVSFKNKDIYKGIEEKEVDLVVADVPEPWRITKFAEKALVPGGCMVCYVPTMNQLIALANADWSGFFEVFALESQIRYMNMVPKAVRPATKGLTHTGYLCFARKG